MSNIRRRHSEIVKILNTAFICLIVLSILCLSVGTASASSSGDQGILGWISNALGILAFGDEDAIANASPEPTDTPTPEPTDTATPTPTTDPTIEPTTDPTTDPTTEPIDTATPTATTDPTTEPMDTSTPTPTSTITATPTPQPAPVYSTSIIYVYATPVPTLSSVNNTTHFTLASPDETMNTTSIASANATENLTSGNVSSVIPNTTSGQQGSPSGNWLALSLITIPAVLAALIVVIQFVRKT